MPIGEDYRETTALDRHQKMRAEAASASIRENESISSLNKQAREPGAAQVIRGEVSSACEAADLLRSRIGKLSATLLGEVPEPGVDRHAVAEGPPYGGEMAELFYTVQQLRGILNEANAMFHRLERLA